jgi:hypothetical protein
MAHDARRERKPAAFTTLMREMQRGQATVQETAGRLCTAALWHVQRLQELMALPQAGLLRQDHLLARLKAVQGSEGVEARFAQAAACDDEQQAQRLYLSVAAEMEELVDAIDNAKEYHARLDDAVELVQGAYTLLAQEQDDTLSPADAEAQQAAMAGDAEHAAGSSKPSLEILGGCLERLAMAHEVQQPALLDEAFVMLQTLGQGGAAQSH